MVREGLEFVVTDMSQFPGSFAGIVGNDIFRRYSLVLDIPAQRLELSDAARPALGPRMVCIPNARPERQANMAGFSLAKVDVRLAASAPASPVVAVIDSGAAISILNWPAVRALGLSPGDPGLKERARPRGINGASSGPTTYSLQLEGLTLAGWDVSATEIRVSDFPVFEAIGLADTPAMILGADILHQRAFGIGKGAAEFCVASDPSTA